MIDVTLNARKPLLSALCVCMRVCVTLFKGTLACLLSLPLLQLLPSLLLLLLLLAMLLQLLLPSQFVLIKMS